MYVSSRTSIISNFQRLFKVAKKFSPFRSDNDDFAKSFLKFPSRCISSSQQDETGSIFSSKTPTVEQLLCRTAR